MSLCVWLGVSVRPVRTPLSCSDNAPGWRQLAERSCASEKGECEESREGIGKESRRCRVDGRQRNIGIGGRMKVKRKYE